MEATDFGREVRDRGRGCSFGVCHSLRDALAATGKPVGLVLNFSEAKVQVNRKVRELKQRQTEFKAILSILQSCQKMHWAF